MRITTLLLIALLAAITPSAYSATIWQEGEKPAASTMNRHPWWYDKVKTEQLSGGAWISNFSDQKEGSASYKLAIPEDAEYAFWLRANPVKSKLAYRIDGGDWKDVDFEKAQNSINIAADDKPDLRFIAWEDLGKLKLTKGQHAIEFKMTSATSHHGAIDCFVLTTEAFDPATAIKAAPAATVSVPPQLAAVADDQSWPFNPPADKFTDSALLDLRYLNEKTAGEKGYIKQSADGMSFVRGDGAPIRFWGIGSGVYSKSAAEIETHCRFLAKMGVNMVRLHTLICDTKEGAKITDVNNKEIDGIIRFVGIAKKHGIYCTISPYWAHAKAPVSWNIEGYAGQELWGILFFNPELQAGYKAWVKELYTRKNPESGIALKDEPAVAIIQVKNEDSLLFWTFQGIKDPQKRILAKQFGDWLKQKHGSIDNALAAWNGDKLKNDDVANGIVWFYQTYDMTQKSAGGKAKRLADQTEFISWRMREFYADIEAHCRALGCKQLVNAMNWRSADAVLMDDSERWSYTANEVIAVNRYVGVMHTGANNGYRIDPGHQFVSESVLKNPLTLPAGLKQPLGHPIIITESAWVHPTAYQSEGPFLMNAYQSLNGVDCMYWFATGETTWLTDPRRLFWKVGSSYAIDKWSVATPEGVGQFPINALAYRLGYITQAKEPAVYEERTLDNMWARKAPIISEAEKFDPNRDKGDFAPESSIKQEVDPLAFLVGPVVVKFGGNPSQSKVADLSKYISRDQKTVRSLTGEIAFNYDTGFCTVSAAKFQGVSGFLSKSGGKFELPDVSISSENEYATLAVAAMDDKPIKSSQKVLIQVGTTARLGGWQTKPVQIKKGKTMVEGEEIVNTGTPPWRIVNTRATVTLRNPSLSKARLLDLAGYPAGEVAVKKDAGGVTIQLPANTMYLVVE